VAGASAAAGQTTEEVTSDGGDLIAASVCAGNGRVPFVLKIGVTGHRRLTNAARTAQAVSEAVRLIKGLIPDLAVTEVWLSPFPPLAEGYPALVQGRSCRVPHRQ
jgi:hypothetical protein